ncbi:hypothetical protein HAX54_028394 [Datura stramonium]|uniref:Uncharacterized protein n=1 Tax=Datura stramonium TaxID=4076 RepID=A0ABS8V4G0_DATST|nr:hypothetical protein [Datura stramonium]
MRFCGISASLRIGELLLVNLRFVYVQVLQEPALLSESIVQLHQVLGRVVLHPIDIWLLWLERLGKLSASVSKLEMSLFLNT